MVIKYEFDDLLIHGICQLKRLKCYFRFCKDGTWKILESLFYILNQHFGDGEIVRGALES